MEGTADQPAGGVVVVGVAGGSGSGKSTVVRELRRKLGHERTAVLHHDAYYRDLSDLPVDERATINFDHPESLAPHPVLILDGILVLAEARLRALMDLTVFVDTDADIRLVRRLRRDIRDRGRSPEAVLEQYESTVRPMHRQFVEPSKRYAGLLVPEGGHNRVAVDLVANRVQDLLEARGHALEKVELG